MNLKNSKHLFSFLFSLMLLTSIYAQDFPPNPIEKAGWTLDFSEEFNGNSLDTTKFTEQYLPHWSTWELSKANYAFRNGALILKIDEGQGGWTPGSAQKISGIATGMRDGLHRFGKGVNILGHHRATRKYETKYGYFELRAKAQKGGAIHSAWWMVGSEDKPIDVTEIDIFEILGNKIGTNKSVVNASVHHWDDPRTQEKSLNYSVNHNIGSEFHIYGFEWDETGMKWYFDNKLVNQTSQKVDYKMVTILSLYESPSNPWSGIFDPTAPYPKTFEIDYFRVYKKPRMHEDSQIIIPGENIAPQAIKGANVSWKWLNAPSNLGDNNMWSTFQSRENPTFPEYLYFDWEHPQSFNSITLKSFFAQAQAPTSWDIEVSEDGLTNWQVVASVNSINWSKNDETIESQISRFNKVNNIKAMRIKIKNANLYWKHYAINEILIEDKTISNTDVNIALSATPYSEGSKNIGSLTDGNLKTAMQSKDSWFFTEKEVLLKWDEVVCFNTLKFHTWYGQQQGIKSIDIYTSKDGELWNLLLDDYKIDWEKDSLDIEAKQIQFDTVEGVRYLNIIVKDANDQWRHFAINELEIFNK